MYYIGMRRQICVINKSSHAISFNKLYEACKDLQTQIDRDLFPIWGRQAQITPIQSADIIPRNVWPVVILDKSRAGLGVHLDKNGKPFAEVTYDPDSWESTTITISHEILEMLVDPYGNYLRMAPSIEPSSNGRLVRYLIEVGDPCEMYSYNIGNTAVSDFITPEFYNINSSFNSGFDLLQKLEKPLEVPIGGYISYQDPVDNHWHQKDTKGNFKDIGPIDNNQNPREDRDSKGGEENEEKDKRHDLKPILASYNKKLEMPISI